MEVCTFYTHKIDLSEFVDNLKENGFSFLEQRGEEKNFEYLKISVEDNEIEFFCRQRVYPDFKIDEIVDDITKNLVGMSNYYSVIDSKHLDIKARFLHKIGTINSEIGIKALNGFPVNFKRVLLKLVEIYDGFVFSSQNSMFSLGESNNGAFDFQGNLIFDSNGNSELANYEVLIDSKYLSND